jgi:hypothetical protein
MIALVLEYVDGGTLSDLVIEARKNKPKIEEAVRMFHEIL